MVGGSTGIRRGWVVASLLLGSLLGQGARAETILIDNGSPIRYLANSTDPGIAMTWVDPAYDDALWALGTLPVGYETASGAEQLIQTPVPPGTPPAAVTTALRATCRPPLFPA